MSFESLLSLDIGLGRSQDFVEVGKGSWGANSQGGKKAHLIAKGFTQVYGIDSEETFSLVAQFQTVHILLALAVLKDCVRDKISSSSQPNVGRGRNLLRGIAGFWNSESGALLQRDFSFSLYAAPKFQVLVSQIYMVVQNLSEGSEGLMCRCGDTESV